MYLKIHRSGIRTIVAAGDHHLLGKELEQGDVKVTISEAFYKGKIASKDEVIDAIRYATSVNLFGDTAVSCAIDCGAVVSGDIMYIGDVMHAQIYRM